MPETLRRSQDQRPQSPRPAVFDGLLLSMAMAILAILSSSLGVQNSLPPLWPAAPVLLGAMLRFAHLAHGWAWLGAWIGLVAAQYIYGVALSTACWLALSTVLSSGLGYITLSQVSPHSASLRTSNSMLLLLLACLLAAVADGLMYAQLAPALSLGLPPRSMLHWFASSLVAYVAWLPMVLTFPGRRAPPRYGEHTASGRLEIRMLLPVMTLALCATAAWAVQGRAAPIFALPALLWCALAYPLWFTALLTTALGVLFSVLPVAGTMSGSAAVSATQGWTDPLALAALLMAPLTLASTMTSHRDLEQRLRVMADFDPLTRLPVRNAFFQWGHKLLQHRYLQRLPVSVLLLDVDQLQQVNEAYGHAAGDKVLTVLGQHLHSNLRRQDCLGRLGGEEFGIILCSQTEEDVQQVVQRICQLFAQQPIVLDHGETVYCSVSIGGVLAKMAPLSLAALLSQAEQALRVAKRRDKGQWELRAFQAPVGAVQAAPEDANTTTHTAVQRSTAPRTTA